MKVIVIACFWRLDVYMIRRTTCVVSFLAVVVPAWGQGFELLDTLIPDFSGDATQDHIPLGPHFGYSIAADGGWLMVGTPHYRWSGTHKPGMVAWFERVGDQWQPRGRETLTSGEFDEALCGHAVALVSAPSGRDTAFGCPFANNVFIFRRNPGGMDWSFVASVSPSSGTIGFGRSVAITAGSDGQWLWMVVGAPDWNSSQGKVFVYGSGDPANQVWSQVAELTAPNGQNLDEFGASIAYRANGGNHEDDLLVVGAPGRHTGGDTSLDHRRGTVSVFRHGATAGDFTHEGDVLYQCLIDPTGICTDRNQPMRFGHAVAIDDEEAVWIGAPNFDYNGETDVGRVYRARYRRR